MHALKPQEAKIFYTECPLCSIFFIVQVVKNQNNETEERMKKQNGGAIPELTKLLRLEWAET